MEASATCIFNKVYCPSSLLWGTLFPDWVLRMTISLFLILGSRKIFHPTFQIKCWFRFCLKHTSYFSNQILGFFLRYDASVKWFHNLLLESDDKNNSKTMIKRRSIQFRLNPTLALKFWRLFWYFPLQEKWLL